jgi:hypothetical protein
LETCSRATASTAAWISLVGMLGSKTFTFGPRSGAASARGAALAVPASVNTANSAITSALRADELQAMRVTSPP